jgi:exodeoxyribonuclease VII small subunit
MTETTLTYEKAYAELSEIAKALESETITVDELAEKVKRGAFLINFCKTKLQTTETDVNTIIAQMEQKS